jgi:ElaB/YqjD/DUF883 family membrane-anchored ribosome-binding protein
MDAYTGAMSENNPSAQADDLKVHAKEALLRAGDRLSEQASHFRDFATDARYQSEDFIQTKPWIAVGIAAGVGFMAGILVARR